MGKKKRRKKLIEDDESKIEAYLRSKKPTIIKPAYAHGAERGPSAKARAKKRKSD